MNEGQINGCAFIDNFTFAGATVILGGKVGHSKITNSAFVRNGFDQWRVDSGDIVVEGGNEARSSTRVTLENNTLVGGYSNRSVFVRGFYPATVLMQNMIYADYPLGITRMFTTAELIISTSIFTDVALPLSEVDFVRGQDTIISPGTLTGTHLVEKAPRLAPDSYHLLPDSPAIDAGAPGAPSTDIDGEFRPQRGAPDIGADEFYDTVPLSDMSVNCPPASAGVSLLAAQSSPANASRPVTYTISTPGEPPRSFTGWTSDTFGVPWVSPGAKTVTVTASNGLGSVTRDCTIAVSAAARVFWMPEVGR
jgi:hypothetical protein